MTSRVARAAVLVVALGSLAAAAYVVFDAEQTLKAHQMARTGFDGAAESVLSDLGRLKSAEQACVAEGQAGDYWLAQATDAQAKVDRGLASLAGDATDDGTRSAIQAASGVLEELRKLDLRARQYLKNSQPLMASDVIFTDGLTAGKAVAEHVATARASEAAVHDAAIEALRWREFYAAGSAGLLLALAVLLLTPVPEKEVDVLTAMRALTETPGAAKRVERTPAPAAARAAIADDDVPGVEAVMAVTGRTYPDIDTTDVVAPPVSTFAANAAPVEKAEDAPTVDLPGAAKVCADMARVLDASDLPGLMLRLAGVLGSSGLIVWVADRSGQVLMPLLTHGYPASAVARIGSLPTSAENATTFAWRTGDVQIVPGALVAPIVTSEGCVGVLAAELPEGSESRTEVRALATIFAAQLATFVTALPSVGGEQIAAST
jgi:hypothetical protein